MSTGNLLLPLVVPSITLGGRQSKLVVTDYAFGASSRAFYSTAQILYAGVIDGRDVLFLYGDSTQSHEAAILLTGTPNHLHNTSNPDITFTASSVPSFKGTIVSFLPGLVGLSTVWDSSTQLVLYADTPTAASFWSPVVAGADAGDAHRNYWSIGSNESILVGGPYLVRSAALSGSELALRGDLNTSARLVVIAPKSVKSVTWNGETVDGDFGLVASGMFEGQLVTKLAASGISVPKLGGWKFRDSLPEIQKTFDDSSWVEANHTSTNIPFKPYYGDGRILYGCDYGLCVFHCIYYTP